MGVSDPMFAITAGAIGGTEKRSQQRVPVNRAVVERIQRLKSLTVEGKAGRAVRRYPAAKASGTDT